MWLTRTIGIAARNHVASVCGALNLPIRPLAARGVDNSQYMSPFLGEPPGGHWFGGTPLVLDEATSDSLTTKWPVVGDKAVFITRGRAGIKAARPEVLLTDCSSTLWDVSPTLLSMWGIVNEGPLLLGNSAGVNYWAIEVDTSNETDSAKFADGEWVSSRALVGAGLSEGVKMNHFDAAIGGRAVALLNWHRNAMYCGRTGNCTTRAGSELWRETADGRRSYPRIDPAVIMAVVSADEECVLLGQVNGAAHYTCLAGFIGQGESAEDACRRETLEETGVTIDKVVLHSTQPWPVGRSGSCELMIGCIAKATAKSHSKLDVDHGELQDARWFPRETVSHALERSTTMSFTSSVNANNSEELLLPGPNALAHHLLSCFVRGFSFLKA